MSEAPSTFIFGTLGNIDAPSEIQREANRMRETAEYLRALTNDPANAAGQNPATSSPAPAVTAQPSPLMSFGSPPPAAPRPQTESSAAMATPITPAVSAPAEESVLVEEANDSDGEDSAEDNVDYNIQAGALPAGYPEISLVITDQQAAATLSRSAALPYLSHIAAKDVIESGPVSIQTSATREQLSAYHQLVMTAISVYYSTTPPAPFELTTIKLIHMVHRTNTTPGQAPYEELRDSFSLIYNEGLTEVVLAVGKILLPSETRRAPEIGEETNIPTLSSLFSEVRSAYPHLMVTYDMIYQVAHGGIVNIAPIPEIIRFDPVLCDYINRVAAGDKMLIPSHIKMEPRNVALPSHRPTLTASGSISRPPPQTTSAPTSSTPIVVVVPTLNLSDVYGDAPVSAPVEAPVSSTPMPAVFTPSVTVTANPLYAPHAESSRAAGARNNRNPLLAAGGDQVPPPVRDTSIFVAIMEFISSQTAISQQMSSSLNEVVGTMNNLIASVATLNERVDRIDGTLALLTAQRSAADQVDRVNINRTLLGGTQPVAQANPAQVAAAQPVPAAPLAPVVPPAAPQRQALPGQLALLISRVEAYSGGPEGEALVADLKNFFIAHGKGNTTGGITAAGLAGAMSKSRILQRLRSCATQI